MNKKRAQQIFNALNKASKQALQIRNFLFLTNQTIWNTNLI